MTLKEFLLECGVETREIGSHHHATQGWIQVDCPWCSPHSKRFRLGINLSYHYCSCWTCGQHKLTETLVQLTSRSFTDCLRLLKTLGPVKVASTDEQRGRLVLPSGVDALKRIHRDYLASRDYNIAELERLWQIRGIGLAAKLAWRIFIPIIQHGQTVSWTTRAVVDNIPDRYRNARPEQERISAKHLLYGMDYCQHACIVVEGPLDVWKIGPGSVATLGISYSKEQVTKIAQFPRRYICFDNEPLAQQRAKSLCNLLSPLLGETSLVQLDAKDPGEASRKEIYQLRRLLS